MVGLEDTTASTAPAATWDPSETGRSVTTPSCGAVIGVLHLHRLEHQHRVAGGDLLARLDGEAYDGAGHRREQRAARHLVGGVHEPRHPEQRDVPEGALHVDPVTHDVHGEPPLRRAVRR